MNSVKGRISALKEYAQRAAPGASVSTLIFADGKYRLACGTWDGKRPGTSRDYLSAHDTHDEAIDAYHDFLKRHPAKDPVFIDCTFREAEA